MEVNDNGENLQPVEYKYFKNYLEMWWALALLLIGVVLVLFGIIKSLLKPAFTGGIWMAGLGTIFVVMTLFWVMGYNGTAYYPSTVDAASSLNLRNSSSSEFTLTAMSIVSLLVPFVLAYIAWVWHKMDHVKLTSAELEETEHKY